ncbi:hypothetical protein [Methylobacter psychrophilus]|uniref:hypothetical protein n=1 Tax=Methylobacter psychrophilus TaxID=96941 RepID=UPI0021D519A1|nr:hypothetical protein [Methylobacter psychrophilus]
MNAVELLRLIKTQGFDVKLQEQVISLADAELAYRFAHDLLEADLERLELVIVAAQIPRIAYEFALIKAARGGNIKKLQDMIIHSADGGLMLLFAADVEGADIELFEEAIRCHPEAKFSQLFEAEMRQKGFY